MRLAFVIQSLHGGGAEFVTREWIRELAQADVEVFVYLYDAHGPDGGVQDATVRRFPFEPKWVRLATLAPWLRHRCRADRIDVVLSMLSFSNLVTVFAIATERRSSRPCVIISERNVATIALERKGRTGKLQRSLARRAYRHADAVVAISHPVAGDLIGGYGCQPETTFVVPNPSMGQVRAAGQVARDAAARREPWSGPGSTLELVFVARLLPQKRPDLFIATLAELHRRGITVRGRIIGDGPMRRELEDQVRATGVDCDLLGWEEPWQAAASGAHVMLLPSKVEGFGNVFVEAAAVRLPSVAWSSSLGAADAIIPGVTGVLTLTATVTELAEAALDAARMCPIDAPPAWLERFSSHTSGQLLLRAIQITLASRSTA
jgi:glycosyltransferase involved in cell wall biosynthesis